MPEVSPSRALSDGETVVATVEVEATPERIFEALTTKEVERWWGAPDVYCIKNWSADLRIGGRWSLDVCLPDGTVLPASGEFLNIQKPHRIAQTRMYKFDHPTLGRRVTAVTYTLDRSPRGTRITVRHDGFGGLQVAADEHAAGWVRLLNWLEKYLKHSQHTGV